MLGPGKIHWIFWKRCALLTCGQYNCLCRSGGLSSHWLGKGVRVGWGYRGPARQRALRCGWGRSSRVGCWCWANSASETAWPWHLNMAESLHAWQTTQGWGQPVGFATILPAARLELGITIVAAVVVMVNAAAAAVERQYLDLRNAAGAVVLWWAWRHFQCKRLPGWYSYSCFVGTVLRWWLLVI